MLRETVPLSKKKLLNPAARTMYGGISGEKPVLVVLAAGKGTRFGTEPKCIQAVCGVPLARHTIDAFRRAGDSPAICLVSYRHEEVMEALGEDNIYIRSDNPAGGTAFAAWEAFSLSQLEEEDPLLIVTMGDRVVPASIFERLLSTHGSEDEGLTFLTAHYQEPRNRERGRILRNESGEVLGIVEQRDIDTCKDQALKARLTGITECNCPLYALRARTLKEALAGLSNDNAQGQYYLTDIVSVLKERGEPLRTVTVYPRDKEYDLLCSDVTRAEDLALLEGIMSSTAGVEAMEESMVKQAAQRITEGRSAGQIASIARQLEELYAFVFAPAENREPSTGFRADRPLAVGISGGRLRIAFMHPDMERFYGPAWQMPIGAGDESGDEQICILLQEARDQHLHLFPMNFRFREKISAIPSNTEILYPSEEVHDIYSYEEFGTKMSAKLLLSLGYFSDEELETRRRMGLPLPPSSLWVSSNMRRPFTLVANAIASIRTLRYGNLGARVQKRLGKNVFRGMRIATTGTIPQGGFSSSSAVTLATKNAINSLYELGIPVDLLIHLASQAEYGTGVRAGSLDQATEQKGSHGEGALISSNPRDNYRIIDTFPVPTERFAILFPYSVERDREAWKWSWGFYGSGAPDEPPTAGEMRKLTGKAAAIAATLIGLPQETDFFKVIEEDLIESGELGVDMKIWIGEVLRQIPLSISKAEIEERVREAAAAQKEHLFTEWRTPKIPVVREGQRSYREEVPLRAMIAYLFAETVRNFWMIHHPQEWIRCVSLSQRGDKCFSIDPHALPAKEEMQERFEWEEQYEGPRLLDAWLSRFGAVTVDYNEGIRDEDLLAGTQPDFLETEGGNFFRGLALIDLAEAMLESAFGTDSTAVRVNAAGQGDYFQVHIDRQKADPEEVKHFIRRAFYTRFGLSPPRDFVELHPGAGAVGTRLQRADMLPQVIRLLREHASLSR